VRELVEAKVKNLPIPQDEPVKAQPAKVINLMDALRKSISAEGASAPARGGKKPPASEKAPAAKGIGLVKGAAKTTPKRKSA